MKIKKESIAEYKYFIELDEQEMKAFEFLFDYLFHRAFKHNTPATEYAEFIRIFRCELMGR